jgi:hypothetical protein
MIVLLLSSTLFFRGSSLRKYHGFLFRYFLRGQYSSLLILPKTNAFFSSYIIDLEDVVDAGNPGFWPGVEFRMWQLASPQGRRNGDPMVPPRNSKEHQFDSLEEYLASISTMHEKKQTPLIFLFWQLSISYITTVLKQGAEISRFDINEGSPLISLQWATFAVQAIFSIVTTANVLKEYGNYD